MDFGATTSDDGRTDGITKAVSKMLVGQNAPSASSTSSPSATHISDHSHINTTNITPQTPLSPSSEPTPELHDLICVGFGPATLAIAIAIHDTFPAQSLPRCLFLEKQSQFAWHPGMQIPGAKMQISFLKDLATPRQPTSTFTFLSYLHSVGRLHAFINLSTFLPTRKEFEAYLKWCASKFEEKGQVRYNTEVIRVSPDVTENGRVVSWEVIGRTSQGEIISWRTKYVVVAPGGRAVVPEYLRGVDNIYHSSQYVHQISRIESKIENTTGAQKKDMRFAVIGGGQSAAEIFNDLWDRFPEAEVRLIIKGSSLRPSDDSPFVNEIFDPDRVSQIFSLPPNLRASAISRDKSTNYSVVRLELLEHLYEKLYLQRLDEPDETKWRCRIVANRVVKSATSTEANSKIRLMLAESRDFGPDARKHPINDSDQDVLDVDYLFTATGYLHDAHEEILAPTEHLLSLSNRNEKGSNQSKFQVGRDYRVQFDDEKVDGEQAGIWLQGCNESTHGLSDTLLSILAIRGGELVQGIFGKRIQSQKQENDTLS